MQSDKELLMLAAKAGGLKLADFQNQDAPGLWLAREHANPVTHSRGWNSLTDDGDIARLEAACEIDVEWQRIGVVASRAGGERFREAYSSHGGDKNKARRYASTRAAASLAQAAQEGV